VVREWCPYRGRGLYTLRAVLTDPETDEPAGAHAVYRLEPQPVGELLVAGLRLGHNTGGEFLLAGNEEKEAPVPRDVERRAFVPLLEGDTAASTDRLLFRYVLCGPSRDEAKARVRRLVYHRDAGETKMLFLLPDADTSTPPDAAFAPSSFCVEIEDRVPEGTLERPGEYGFAVLASSENRVTQATLSEALSTGEGAGLLAHIEFRVD
jgi:hypothetical protein